jgi:iron complex outermembrane receptor protein
MFDFNKKYRVEIMICHSKRGLSGASMLIIATLGMAPVVVHSAYAAEAGAFSEQEGNEIVVTATKRSTSLQKVPFSINAQSEDDIRKTGATTLEDLSRNVAGLSIQNLGPGQSQVSIRGVSAGQIVRDQPGVKEQVGIYLDESVISLSLFTPDLDLFDLARVETLRGPQGTLFGSGSEGGTIRYITNQPKIGVTEGEVEGDINLIDGGSMGGHLKGAINLPMGDKAAVRAVAYSTRYPGYIDALRQDGSVDKNVNNGWRNGGRFAINFKPSDNLSFTPRIVYQKVTTKGFNRQESYNLFANPFMTNPVTLGQNEQFLLLREGFRDETIIADGTIKAGFDGVDLTSVTSYTHRDILVSRDASALTGSVSVDLGYPAAAVALPSNLRDTTKVKSFTQELRLSSNGDGPLQWVVGGFYANTKRNYTQRLPTPGYDAYTDAVLGAGTSAAVANGFPANSPYDSDLAYNLKQVAVFGEGSYKIDRVTATVGGRYFDYKEDRTISQGGLFGNITTDQVDKTSSKGFTPRFLLSYEASNDITINAQASKGFRLAGVNDPLNVNLCTAQDRAIFGGYQSYGNENTWNYEAGIKARGHGFTFNAAVFYDDIKNLQVTLDAGSCSSRVVFNVPKAHSEGIEFELSAQPAKGLELGVSGSLISSKFDSTVVDGSGAVLGGIRDGNRLPSVPKFQISANARYSYPVAEKALGFVGATVQYVGDRYTQPSDQENNPRSFVSGLAYGGATGAGATVLNLNLPSYTVVNMNFGVDFDNGLSLMGYVNNVFDKNALLSFDRERGGRARLGFATNQPRTFGAQVRKSF